MYSKLNMDLILKIFFILILSLALLLRIWNLSSNPPEIFTDELSNFTSAKSVIETGKDLNGKLGIYFWGRVAPHPPIYGYSSYITSRIFGENAFGIRFAAAVHGVLTVILIYLITKYFFKNYLVSLFAALTLAILPWHIHFSRVGWEPAAFLPFFLFGLLLILEGLHNKITRLVYLAFLFFGLSAYTYFGSWFYSLLFLILLVFFNKTFFLKNKKILFNGIIIYSIFIVPLFLFLNNDPLHLERATRISTFSQGINQQSISIFIHNYLSHFTLDYLFISGDPNLRHGAGTGVLYWWMLPFILIGLFFAIKNIKKSWDNSFLILWLVIYPLGGALTNDGVPHAMRTLIGAPIFCILTALGFKEIFDYLSIKKLKLFKIFFLLLTFSIILLELFLFSKRYFVNYPIFSATYWQYGHKEIFEIIKKNENNYQRVCLGNLDYWGNKELLYFYLYNSKLVIFETWNHPRCFSKNSLLVIPKGNTIPKNSKIIQKIYSLNKNLIYTIVSI